MEHRRYLSSIVIDTKLNAEHMEYLHRVLFEQSRSQGEEVNMLGSRGNVTRFSLDLNLVDKDNWFYESAIKDLSEQLFYRIEKRDSPPEFKLDSLWVNFQKQYDYVPLHNHNSLFSFVIFFKIPVHKEKQVYHDNLPDTESTTDNFEFVWSESGSKDVNITYFHLSPEDEGRILFFHSWLKHQVYPFYGTEKEERITFSGNVCLKEPDLSGGLSEDECVRK